MNMDRKTYLSKFFNKHVFHSSLVSSSAFAFGHFTARSNSYSPRQIATLSIIIIMIPRVRVELQSDPKSAESEFPVQLIMSRLLSKEISLRKLSSRKPTTSPHTKRAKCRNFNRERQSRCQYSDAATSHTC